jgi:uncharacterized protein (TIGR03435 family)
MLRGILIFCLSVSVCAVAAAQPAFEAASIKKVDPAAPRAPAGVHGGPGTGDPGLLTITGYTIKGLIFRAYDVTRAIQYTGPDWMEQEHFNVTAKVPAGATKEQANAMLQNLLTSRFKLKVHHQSRQFPGFVLTIAKGGSKLKESPKSAAPDAGEPQATKDKEGFFTQPEGKPGIVGRDVYGHARFYGRMVTLDQLASMLESAGLGGRVVNNTGLTGSYDFQLDFSDDRVPADRPADNPAVASDPGISLQAAVQKQLGLKIEETKLPYDIIVVDSAERQPTDD